MAVTTFRFKLDRGGRGEGWGERKGGGRLTFENPFSWRLVQESNYSHFFSRETQRCCSALGETSSINSAGIV